jgi:hypothetical protein
VGFVVERMELGLVFLQVSLGFPCLSSFHHCSILIGHHSLGCDSHDQPVHDHSFSVKCGTSSLTLPSADSWDGNYFVIHTKYTQYQ